MLKTGPDVSGLSRQQAREARLRFWRETVAAALASGQTQTEYCRVQGISAGAYFWWKKILARMERGLKLRAARGGDARTPKARFLPLTVRGLEAGADASYVLEIGLGADRVVRVREGCDPKLLETAVRLIGGLPC